MTWNILLPQGNESLKCRWDIVPYTRGRGIDVGCGSTKLFAHFIGVDNMRDTRLFQAAMDPDIVADAMDMPFFTSGSLDFVFSSHTLEHIEDHVKALTEWWRVVKQDGHLVLYLPHADFYPRIGEKGSNDDHKHDFLPDDIVKTMAEIGNWDLVVREERDGGDEYSMLLVFRKKAAGHEESWKAPEPARTCAICRFGAWGDAIQMSSILPGLKDQGYHITLYTTSQGLEVVKHEPLIDRVILQDHDQVPNPLLGEYWAHIKTKYTKWINLSESVETQFLAMPGRVVYTWPQEARHQIMNENYGETLHLIAGVPYTEPQSRFVATKEESMWADDQVIKVAGHPIIMMVLAGSAIHKLYPHVDKVLEGILSQYPSAKIITVGSKNEQDLIEPPWADQPRILCRSGVWSIRETMVMAARCDMVIGPETGVMNSVAMNVMPKIIFLSHSSEHNLTRDWVNTTALSSQHTPCHPCHKMVYTWDQCVKDDTGTAKCMADIPYTTVLNAVNMNLPRQREAA